MEVEIKFRVKNIDTDVVPVMMKLLEQIDRGEYYPDGNENGYLLNKYNSIEIRDSEGYSIGQFRIMEKQ
jgi:hypothetical protein